MTREEYELTLRQAYLVAQMLRRVDVRGALDVISRAESIGPILDPTLWMRNSQKMHEDKAVVGILARARAELDKLPWPDAGEAAG